MWTLCLILGVACFVWAHKRNLRWIKEDVSDYIKSHLELAINREIKISSYAQWRGKHRPPTYPEDL